MIHSRNNSWINFAFLPAAPGINAICYLFGKIGNTISIALFKWCLYNCDRCNLISVDTWESIYCVCVIPQLLYHKQTGSYGGYLFHLELEEEVNPTCIISGK